MRRLFPALAAALLLATTSCTPAGPTVTLLPGTFAAGKGRLVLQVAGLRGRRLQATVDQVAALRVRLTGPSPVEARLATDDLEDGQGAIAIGELTPGSYTLRLDALDAADLPIGTKSTTASVSAGITTVVDVNLKLDPTQVSVGGLYTQITIEDGDVQSGS